MSARFSSRREFLGTATAGAAAGLAANVEAAQAPASPLAAIRHVGVVGIGGRGSGHVRTLCQFEKHARVVAVCDLVPERAEKGKSLAGGAAEPYTDFAKMLRHPDLDTVVIATPNYAHKALVVAALDGGFYTFVEKPMACTIEDCNAIIDAARRNRGNRNKGICQVGLQLRHHPLYRRIHQMVGEGAVGDLKFVWCENFRGDWRQLYEDPEEDKRRNWRFSQRLSGGSIVEKNCHDLDIFGWIIGARPLRVAGTGGLNVYTGRQTLDHFVITIDYENGCKLALGTCLYARGRHDTVVIGSKGMLEFPRGGQHMVLRRKGKKDERIEVKPDPPADKIKGGTYEMFAHLLEQIREGKPAACSPTEGKESIRIALAGEIAVGEKRSVWLSEMPA